MDEMGREMMDQTSREIKQLNMKLHKIFSPSKKVLTLDPDWQSRDIIVHENDYVNVKIPIKTVRDGLVFSIKTLDPHDKQPSNKVDLKLYFSYTT
jgi:hypothetical protein